MADPPKVTPEIPEPTREDLLRLVHAEYQDKLAAGTFPANIAEGIWADARRQWDEGHKAEAARRAEEHREQKEGFNKLVGSQEPEPPKPQLGAIIADLKKSAGGKPEPPVQETLQKAADEFTLHVGRQVEDVIARHPAFTPPVRPPSERKKPEKAKRAGGSLSRWLTVKPLPPSAGRFRSAFRDVVVHLLEFGPLGIIITLLLAGGGVALVFASSNPRLYLLAEILFAVAIFLFAVRCIYEFRTHENRRIISSIFFVLGVIVLGLTIGLFELYRPHPASQLSPKPLHEYFDEEVNNGLHRTLTLNVIINNQTIPVQMRMSLNFQDRAEWLAFYVPDISEEDTFQVCTQLLDGYEGAIALFVQAYQGKIEVGPIGGRAIQVKDLKFTGYVRLYHETSLNQSELDSLTAQAQKKGLSVESRSTYYLLSRMPK